MAIYKPSNSSPALEEVDLKTHNDFSLQNNTSGETAKAYKLTILSERGDNTVYEGDIHSLSPAVRNKETISIHPFIVAAGTEYYTDSALTQLEGTLASDTQYSYIDQTKSSIVIDDVTKYIETPENFEGDYSNGKNYQWGARVYNAAPNSTAQPNTLVCEGYIVGSTKYVVWSRIPHEIEITDDMTPAEKAAAEALNQQYRTAKDQIKYDRYIEFTNIPPSNLILSAKDASDVVLPTTNYTERKKIDWSTKDLGTDEDVVKIETTENFKYNYKDGTEYHIYKCSDAHTVNSLFADPNSNINVANFIMVYNSAADALAAFTAKEDPSTGSYTITPKFNTKKIVGYSSDTGEIRVNDAFYEAPQNGQAYRIFSQDISTKLYTELFSSDITFEAPQNTTYYGTIIKASSASPATYYSDKGLTTAAGQITINTSCNFVTATYSTIKMGSAMYYVPTPAGGTTTKAYTTTNVNQNVGYIVIDESTFAIPYVNLTAKIGSTSTLNIFNAQVVGGNPISNSFYKVLSNRWDASNYLNSGTPYYSSNTLTQATYVGDLDATQHLVDYVSGNDYCSFQKLVPVGGGTSEWRTFYSPVAYLNLAERRLFIQPNINIKSDETNPNELVFEQNGCRININKTTAINPTTGKTIDTTFNKLDNTQWLLEGDAITYGSAESIIPYVDEDMFEGLIQTQMDYKVYTDFMDSMPYNLYYGRSTPVIKLYYYNMGSGEYEEFDGQFSSLSEYYPYRDIRFRVKIFADNNDTPAQQAIKYVRYDLYYNGASTDPKSYITSSEDIYESDGDWMYRGFMTKTGGMYYTIVATITDEYNSVFTKEMVFGIQYDIDTTIANPINVDFDCNDKSFKVEMASPVLVISTNHGSIPTVTSSDIEDGVVKIGQNKVLNYTETSGGSAIDITKDFTFLTKFQITGKFVTSIQVASEKEIFSVGYREGDEGQYDDGEFSLRLHGGTKFYWVEDQHSFVVDPDIFKIYLYKNGVKQLGCFDGGDYIDITEKVSGLYAAEGFKYALTGNNKYILTEQFTSSAEHGKRYILQNTLSGGCIYDGKEYKNGVYMADMTSGTAAYSLDKTYEYVFVETLDQIPQEYRADFTTDNTTYVDAQNRLLYIEDNTSWTDGEYLTDINETIFNQLWFTFYLVYDSGTAKCYMDIA